jgi:hypothetical protein
MDLSFDLVFSVEGKGAASILMAIRSSRQLNDLPDELAAKFTIHYDLAGRKAPFVLQSGDIRPIKVAPFVARRIAE